MGAGAGRARGRPSPQIRAKRGEKFGQKKVTKKYKKYATEKTKKLSNVYTWYCRAAANWIKKFLSSQI